MLVSRRTRTNPFQPTRIICISVQGRPRLVSTCRQASIRSSSCSATPSTGCSSRPWYRKRFGSRSRSRGGMRRARSGRADRTTGRLGRRNAREPHASRPRDALSRPCALANIRSAANDRCSRPAEWFRRQDMPAERRREIMSLNESTPNPSKQAPDILLSMPKASRRLAVVLAARIPGPCPTERTESQGANDGACDVRRDLIEPTLAENRGTLVRWTGGDLLALFQSPYAAAHCALVLDNLFRSRNSRFSMRDRGGCRIGLGLGDVLVQSNAIHGDAVTN